jgi:hypothetical protein
MTPQQTGSRQYKRFLAIAGATLVAAAGTIGLAFADSDDSTAPAAKPVTTAQPTPASNGGHPHYPTPTAPADVPCDEGKGPNYC